MAAPVRGGRDRPHRGPGLSLAIDDYGAGSSRLGFIGSRSWQVVKIDRQLVVEHNERRVVVLRRLVQLLAALARHGLALTLEE